MRTWKQGRIGKINLADSNILFVKCLKYPVAQFFREYNPSNQELLGFLFEKRVEKSTLKHIEQIGQQKLSKEERVERSFDIEKEGECLEQKETKYSKDSK
jgi:hypothetical protein